MNIKLFLKAIKNNMVVNVLKIINKPCLIVSSNKKAILKIAYGKTSLIPIGTNETLNHELFREYDNLELTTNKSPIILHS